MRNKEDKPIKKRTKLKIAGNVMTAMITLGLIGVSAYFLIAYHPWTWNQPKNIVRYEYRMAKSSNVLDTVVVDMKETNPEEKDKTKIKHFLSEEGLKKFVGKIEDELNYGPEIYDINRIVIDDENMIGDDANGNYYPQRDEININSSAFRKEGLPAVRYDEHDPYQDVKIELLFQILFHEYEHFLSSEYLKIKSETYGNVTGWDKDFEDRFENILGYDKTTKPMITNPAPFTERIDQTNSIQVDPKYRSMGAIYSSDELYQMSNGINGKTKNFSDKLDFSNPSGLAEVINTKDKYWGVWAGTQPFFKINQSIIAKNDKIGYYWLIDEIYVRKYQQILMQYTQATSDYNDGSNYLDELGFHFFGEKDADGNQNNNITPYALDTSMYKDLKVNGEGVSVGNDYMADNPTIGDRPLKLKDLINEHMGVDKYVSVLYFDNDGKLRIGGYKSLEEDKKIESINIGDKTFDVHVKPATFFNKEKTEDEDKEFWISRPLEPNEVINGDISLNINDKSDGGAGIFKYILKEDDVRHKTSEGVITTERFIENNQANQSNDNYKVVFKDGSTQIIRVGN